MEVGGGCGGRASGGLRGRIDFVLNYRVGDLNQRGGHKGNTRCSELSHLREN